MQGFRDGDKNLRTSQPIRGCLAVLTGKLEQALSEQSCLFVTMSRTNVHRVRYSIHWVTPMTLDGPEGTIVLALVTRVAEEKLDSRLAVDTGNLGFLFITHLTLRSVLVSIVRSLSPFCLGDVSEDFKNGVVDWDLSNVRGGERMVNTAHGALHSFAHHYFDEAF